MTSLEAYKETLSLENWFVEDVMPLMNLRVGTYLDYSFYDDHKMRVVFMMSFSGSGDSYEIPVTVNAYHLDTINVEGVLQDWEQQREEKRLEDLLVLDKAAEFRRVERMREYDKLKKEFGN